MSRGYNALGDIIPTTADGVDLNDIWTEHQQTIELRNSNRSALASLFTYNTDLSADLVAQSTSGADFEESSEYGVPQSLRAAPELVKVGFPFKFFDLATRYTWRFLAEASASQVAAVHSSALEADNKLVFRLIMNALFSNTDRVNEDGVPVKPLWNGDGIVPPEFANQTFSGTHNHYMTTGTADFQPGDLEDLVGTVEHHGYGIRSNGDRVIVLANPREGDVIAGFRAGINGAKHDFIPSSDAPAFITNEAIVGDRPPGEFNGLRVIGAYGDAWVVVNPYVPAGYVTAVATGGANSERNPLAFREHKRPELKGLKEIPGGGTYPLVDAYLVRGAGVGVRHRGAAAVMQVTINAAYTAPVF
jgi:hypothetical protein